MRDEDRDWEIYHLLTGEKVLTAAAIAARGYDLAEVEASLGRLERSHLIERRGDAVRALSFQEAVLLCQIGSDRGSPLYLDNGVIRVRKEGEREE